MTDLRRFHLSGVGTSSAPEGMVPALLHMFRQGGALRTEYPLFLAPLGAEKAERLGLPLADLLQRAAPDGDAARILHDNLLRLELRVRNLLSAVTAPADARMVIKDAGEGLVEELGLGEEESARLEGDLATLIDQVPAGGRLLPFSDQAALYLLEQALNDRTASVRAAFLAEVRQAAEQVRGFLEVDRLKRPGSGAEKSGIGGAGERFIDTSALSGVLGTRHGGSTLSGERRARLESAAKVLGGYLENASEVPITLIHDDSLSEDGRRILGGWNLISSEDPCADAAKKFDEAAAAFVYVLRSVQVARLESEGNYDPLRHGPWLDQLDWKAFGPEELQLIPPVVAMVSADNVAEKGMLSLSRLLLSGRPVQILVTVQAARNPGAGEHPLEGFRFEPSYLGMSHREALVQQGSGARPFHLLDGFARAAATNRTSLHVLAAGHLPGGEEPVVGSWLAMNAAVEGRAHPFFRFDPDAGTSWARRFDFSENPDPEEDWPVYELTARKEDGGEETMKLAFTFADYALLDPAFADEFRAVPGGIPEDDIVPLADYLALPAEEAALKIPFIWAVDATSRMRRLALTRQLAWACRDRLDFWNTLRELAGVRNEYARQAAESVRDEMEGTAREERERLEASYREELERIRREATEDTLARLTAALTEVDLSAIVAPAPAGAGLAGLRGKNVDEVAATLLAAVDAQRLESGDATPGAGGDRVDQVASELLGLVGPERLEKNSQ